ncbi:MAG: DUF1559 domain-containing protein [Planctomycetia bacterium]|nr:DUF1559 domain-containing protein [Planctomycetia bacterium]
MKQKICTTSKRRAFTLIELLTVMVIVLILATIAIPAINGVRAVVQRVSCQNHLRQLGTAFDTYAVSTGGYPAVQTSQACTAAEMGRSRKSRKTRFPVEYGWTHELLPYLEMQAIYDGFDRTRPYYDGETNQNLMRKQIPVFLCPSAPRQRETTMRNAHREVVNSVLSLLPGEAKGGAIDYYVHHGGVLKPDGHVGNNALIYKDERISPQRIFDGLSTTILVDEMAGRPELWVKGKRDTSQYNSYGTQEVELPESSLWGGIPSTELSAWSKDGYRRASYSSTDGAKNFDRILNVTNNGIYSFHVQGGNILMMDGRVKFISENVVPDVYLSLSTRDGEEPYRVEDLENVLNSSGSHGEN